MKASFLPRDDATLRVFDSGAGLPVLFQHGLGGDAVQVATNFPDGPSFRRLTVECRAQGQSTPGSARPFSIALFADDVLAAADAHGIDRFVVGGISMGAAIALQIAARHPGRIIGLVLARPAWLFEPGPDNMRPYAEVAEALRNFPRDEARARFAASPTAVLLAATAPDNLASLLSFFDRTDTTLTAELLGDIAADGPGVTATEAARLRMPTLTIGHDIDHAHPLAYASLLAETIPGARFVQIRPKATDRDGHVAAFRATIDRFLTELVPLSEHQP
jgi:pimeloyl-ACP methyl ester carboxylesterase